MHDRRYISLHSDSASPRIEYARKVLAAALGDAGWAIAAEQGEHRIDLTVTPRDDPPEAFNIDSGKGTLSISAADERGIIHGAQAVAEHLRNGVGLRDIPSMHEAPRLAFRAIKFDLPWDTYRHSHALSLHQETCHDLRYWEAFLEMMSENRFNALTLWCLHPYPLMIRPRNFPEACPWNEKEMEEWTTLFSGIFSMAHERGIDTYIIPFNIFVPPEFSRAHNVAMNNLDHFYFVDGDTSEIVKRYTRECVTQLLTEYPLLTGMGLTLGEGMGGMTPGERETWMKETIIEGMRLAGRSAKLIHRVPFSGNTGSAGATTVEMEQVTRAGIEQEAALELIEQPVWVGLKFNWSHPLSTTRLMKVHGGKLYGTYFEPIPTDYRVFWTARNEDIFCLRWGVAEFIRGHIRENSPEYVGGYLVGSETYIPAKDYFTASAHRVPWRYAFERQWLYYKLWGRLLYDRETPDEVFRAEFRRRYGPAGDRLFEAHSLAGKTPLRLAFSFDCSWDFTLYAEGFMALDPETKRTDFISVERLIETPPMDPSYVQITDYVQARMDRKEFDPARITPITMAAMLEDDCSEALELVRDIDVSGEIALRFEVADIMAWSQMGLYFGQKLRGAVALQTWRVAGNESDHKQAVAHLEKALGHWDQIIAITRPLYNDMPLVHFSEQNGRPWQENEHLRFHWEHLRTDVVADVEMARRTSSTGHLQ